MDISLIVGGGFVAFLVIIIVILATTSNGKDGTNTSALLFVLGAIAFYFVADKIDSTFIEDKPAVQTSSEQKIPKIKTPPRELNLGKIVDVSNVQAPPAPTSN